MVMKNFILLEVYSVGDRCEDCWYCCCSRVIFEVIVVVDCSGNVVVVELYRSGGPRCFGSSKSFGGGGGFDATRIALLAPGVS